MVQCVERPGIHGGSQGVWYGMGKIALGLEFACLCNDGDPGSLLGDYRADQHLQQRSLLHGSRAMAQLTVELMKAELK